MQLKDRFPEKVKQYWIGWYRCIECGKNHTDALHHIISPSSIDYIKGKHNESILNSCPINNHECHLYKPLHSFKKQKELLNKVKDILDQRNYQYDLIDYQFIIKYRKYYEEKTVEEALSKIR